MLCENLQNIRQRIVKAAGQAGRSAEEIKLVAVSKRFSKEKISEAIGCGQRIFGENYIQESVEKIPYITDKHSDCDISWHFIGKLQSNKAKRAVELFDVIETIDSLKLAITIEKHLDVLDKTLTGYVQVNIGREKQKSGVQPEKCASLLQQLAELKHLQIKGLMAMPPFFTDPEKSRPYFKEMRNLAEELVSRELLGHNGPVELSMGMSGDFDVAVEEGATVIRLGTALFGHRQI
jgi:pyridoxal phosphate enzyme (YggS family)